MRATASVMWSHHPVEPCTGDLQSKALEEQHALQGVCHFGMKLHAGIAAGLVAHAGDGQLGALTISWKPGGSAVTLSPWLIHRPHATRGWQSPACWSNRTRGPESADADAHAAARSAE
jgi:hypothetical protein